MTRYIFIAEDEHGNFGKVVDANNLEAAVAEVLDSNDQIQISEVSVKLDSASVSCAVAIWHDNKIKTDPDYALKHARDESCT